MIRRISKSVALVVCIMVLNRCDKAPVYEKYITVPDKGWHADSTATFDVKIKDTNARYAIVFKLRANDQYPYSNLFLFREIRSEKGLEYRDTANVILADAYGKWLGEGIGQPKTFSRPFRERSLRFSQPGHYQFSFTQAMRTQQLKGIEDVGLTIYKQPLDGKKEKEG